MDRNELNQQFKQLLESMVIPEDRADSPECCRQLVTLNKFIKKNIPNRLFRFRCANLHSVLSFEHNTVMACSPEVFSDRFDSVVYVDKEKIYNDTKRGFSWGFLKQLIAEVRQTGFIPEPLRSFYGDVNARFLEEMYAVVSDENLRIALKEGKKRFLKPILESISPFAFELVNSIRQDKETKIACFTEEICSTYMWDTYAGGYTGFALEYDLTGALKGKEEKRKEEQVYLALYPVIYSDSKYDATTITVWNLVNSMYEAQGMPPCPCPDLLFRHKAFLYKDAVGYSHEREWRLMCASEKAEGSKFLEIETGNRMKAIYYGPYIDADIKAHLSMWAKRHKIKEYTVKMDETNKNFNLAIEPLLVS